MTYDELFKYLTNDFIELTNPALENSNNYSMTNNNTYIYGYIFTKQSFDEYKKNVYNYDKNQESKIYVDNIIKEIYSKYQEEINHKN